MSQSDIVVEIASFAIGSSMSHDVAHVFENLVAVRIRFCESADATHSVIPSDRVLNGNRTTFYPSVAHLRHACLKQHRARQVGYFKQFVSLVLCG